MKIIKIWLYLLCYMKKIVLKILYGKQLEMGKNVIWRHRFSMMIDSKGKVVIGNGCFFNNDCSINSNQLVTIGEGTILGENVKIYDHNHRFRDTQKTIKEQGYTIGKVHIGKHCWIGSNVVILKDAVIGDNCVIGAGCVVRGRIPSNSILKMINQIDLEEIN